MNILYFVDEFPKLSESFVINELYELDKRGHDISVFALGHPDETVTHEEVEEMDLDVYYGELFSLDSLPKLPPVTALTPGTLRRAAFLENPVYHVRCLHLGAQIVEAAERNHGVDLIHAHFAAPNRLAVTYAAASLGVPCTVTAHAYEIFAPSNVRRLQRVCSRFDHVIVPSEYNERYLRKEIGVDTEMSVIPATTDVEKFEPSEGCVSGRLLTVARLVEKKGHEYAIDAVAELVERGHDVEYHVVGTGEREQFLRERARDRGIEGRTEFLGHVSDGRLEQELQEAEVFVLPCVVASDGDRDVAPVALKEAMATKTACVSTTVSAIPELITDRYDGSLVDPNDTAQLVDAIEQLLTDNEYRVRIANKGYETVRSEFDISATVDDLTDVFEGVIQSPHKKEA